MGEALNLLTGGLLGGGGGASGKIETPEPVRRNRQKADPSLDPNRSEAVSEARRRRLALQRRTGRSSLRVNLEGADDGSGPTRSGISIR